mmetsp:Transcript_26716/g.79366  ORF Transcript_26716/g.79366 Transcript_26716/m.79366 type:complete len:103 (-) Transcript_26716:496-804(-)|eukprot:356907-Chlamydomonas_euryale.AAC.12
MLVALVARNPGRWGGRHAGPPSSTRLFASHLFAAGLFAAGVFAADLFAADLSAADLSTADLSAADLSQRRCRILAWAGMLPMCNQQQAGYNTDLDPIDHNMP